MLFSIHALGIAQIHLSNTNALEISYFNSVLTNNLSESGGVVNYLWNRSNRDYGIEAFYGRGQLSGDRIPIFLSDVEFQEVGAMAVLNFLLFDSRVGKQFLGFYAGVGIGARYSIINETEYSSSTTALKGNGKVTLAGELAVGSHLTVIARYDKHIIPQYLSSLFSDRYTLGLRYYINQ